MNFEMYKQFTEIQEDALILKDFIQILKDTLNTNADNGYTWKFIDLILAKAENLLDKLDDLQFKFPALKEILQHYSNSNTSL